MYAHAFVRGAGSAIMRLPVPPRIMPRFEKTPLHPASAVLILLGLYALVGLGYALWAHSEESALIWVTVAVLAFIASAVFQRVVRRRRRAS